MRHMMRAGRIAAVAVIALVMAIPLYLLVVNAFKSQLDIVLTPFGLGTSGLTLEPLVAAITAPSFNVVAAYGTTIGFVLAVNVLGILVTGPAAYAIARGTRRYHRITLLVLLTGLFIPGQALVIPLIYVLRSLGLMGTVPGFLLFETTLTIPVTLFLYVAHIQSIPRELDEAARMDGASRWSTFWRVIFPLMRPTVATAAILNTIGVWGDFVNPRIILGPASDLYTVTTGIYFAISRYSTDFTVVYPNLLLAIAPILVFFVAMQRYIVSGLTAGAVKG